MPYFRSATKAIATILCAILALLSPGIDPYAAWAAFTREAPVTSPSTARQINIIPSPDSAVSRIPFAELKTGFVPNNLKAVALGRTKPTDRMVVWYALGYPALFCPIDFRANIHRNRRIWANHFLFTDTSNPITHSKDLHLPLEAKFIPTSQSEPKSALKDAVTWLKHLKGTTIQPLQITPGITAPQNQLSTSQGNFTAKFRIISRFKQLKNIPDSPSHPTQTHSSFHRQSKSILGLLGNGVLIAAPLFMLLKGSFLSSISPETGLLSIGVFIGAWAGRHIAQDLLHRLNVEGQVYKSGILLSLLAGGIISGGMATLLIHLSPVLAAGVLTLSAAVTTMGSMPRHFKQAFGLNRPAGNSLFSIQKEGKKYLLTIRKDQFKKPYLLSITMEKGLSEKWLLSSLMWNEFLWYFERVGDHVQLVAKNTQYRAQPDTPMQHSIEHAVPNSAIVKAKITREDASTGDVTITLDQMFLQDILRLNSDLNELYEGSYNLDNDLSQIEQVKAFPKNVEVSSRITFSRSPTKPLPYDTFVPDASNLSFTIHYSLSALPEGNYKPRQADDRLGHFTTTFQDWAKNTLQNPRNTEERWIQRWHLEKQDPRASISPVKKPIVFYLEDTIPNEYRPVIREAILTWNKAFERIGFKDAIVVKEAAQGGPEFDPSDARFNVVRWSLITDRNVAALGPSRANPLTGEIYNASVLFPANMVDWPRFMYILEEGKSDTNKGKKKRTPTHSKSHLCSYAQECAMQAAVTLSALEAQENFNTEERHRFMKEYIRNVILHEIGHTLGLRHNFKASGFKSARELSQEKNGIVSASAMDYSTVNLPLPGKGPVTFWQTDLGPYDYWAIEYAYKPLGEMTSNQEKEALSQIASRSGQRGLEYATDEDVTGIDPLAQTWYLGNDLLKFAVGRIIIMRDLWDQLEKMELTPGQSYTPIRKSFLSGFSAYQEAVNNAVRYLGGIYHHREHAGDAGGQLPFEPVSSKKQLQTLEFLDEYVFSDKSFAVSPELLKKLSPQRLPTLENAYPDLFYFPYNQRVLNLRQDVLDHIFDPEVLERIVEHQNLISKKERPFSIRELFESVTFSIWLEIFVQKKKTQKHKRMIYTISPMRRELQSEYLQRLIDLAHESGFVPEASSIALKWLGGLKNQLQHELRTYAWDFETQAHLQQALTEIAYAMEKGPSHNR
ncbi:MAG: zinc-dependent metalloprotease [Elusimicrobia bacterium]|nr:zinc-dependent metalloprotease [Elusimicrobiota bacterium]